METLTNVGPDYLHQRMMPDIHNNQQPQQLLRNSLNTSRPPQRDNGQPPLPIEELQQSNYIADHNNIITTTSKLNGAQYTGTTGSQFDENNFQFNCSQQDPSQTQMTNEILTQNAEWTQMGDDDDDDDEMMHGSQIESQSLLQCSPMHVPPPPPQPWGRFMPCSSTGQITQLFPRSPSFKLNYTSSQCAILSLGEHPTAFLRHVKPSDIFNLHTIGRSAKCDIQAKNPSILSLSSRNNTTNTTTTLDKKMMARQEWCYGMISNRHCKIYCSIDALALTNAEIQESDTDEEIANKLLSSLQVWVEDCSGNGTIVNGTTILMKGDKRILNSGDEICLVQKQTLQKKVVSRTELQNLLHEYSFVFVNCATNHHVITTTPRIHTNTIPLLPSSDAANDLASSNDNDTCRAKRKAAVNVRATKSTRIRPSIEPQPPTSSEHGIISTTKSTREKRRNSLDDTDLSQPPSTSITTEQHQPKSRRISPRRQQPRRVQEDYDIRDVLGSGTMGEVRRAIHRRTGAAVAIKVILIHRTNKKNSHMSHNSSNAMMCTTATEIEMEASILQKLQHPYIVKFIDVYICPTAVYLVMELVQGGDLFDRIITKGNYTETESRRVMRRLIAAVHYLHESSGFGIVHRDLKPENILLTSKTSDIDVKLTDFGLAKQDGDLKTFCGTPQYFAPEVFRRRHTVKGNGRYGKQADMWSLGVILYVLLTGSPPFDSVENNPHAMLSSQSNGGDGAQIELYFPNHVSLAAQDMVRQLLQHDPKKRASIVSACTHEWILQDDGDTHIHPLDDPKLQDDVSKRWITSISTTQLATTQLKQDIPISTALDKPYVLDSPPASDVSRIKENTRKIATSAENFTFKKDFYTDANQLSPCKENENQQQRKPLLPVIATKTPVSQSENRRSTASKHSQQHVPTNNVTPSTELNVHGPPSGMGAFDRSQNLTTNQRLIPNDIDNDEIVSRFSENTESVGSFSTVNTYEVMGNQKDADKMNRSKTTMKTGENKSKSLLSKKKRSLSNVSPSSTNKFVSGKTVKQSNQNRNSVTTRNSTAKNKKTTRFRTNIASPPQATTQSSLLDPINHKKSAATNADGRKQLTLNNWFKKHN